MSATAITGYCAGCGEQLPPQNYQGRPRIWCSEQCRKAQYAGTCEDCGAPTCGTTPGRGLPRKCAACEQAQPHTLKRALKAAERQPHRGWSDEQLLAALRRADRRGIRSVSQWNSNRRDDLPSSATIVVRLGSWNRARELAGLPVNSPRRAAYPRLTAEDCACAVASVWEALGSTPGYEVYEGYRAIERPDLPSASLVRVRCGTWVHALEMAAKLIDERAA